MVNTYPKEVQDILNSFDENIDIYHEAKRMVIELNNIGWTAEYYLDGELYNIRKKD
jgi:hypothetical protein